MPSSTVANRGLCYGVALQSTILKAPTEMQNERELRLGGEEEKLWRLPARERAALGRHSQQGFDAGQK